MRRKRRTRTVVDTNLWISFLIGKSFIDFKNVISKGNILLLYSEDLLSELQLVMHREKFRKYFNEEAFSYIKEILVLYGEEIEVVSEVLISKDPKDNFLLELSKDGEAGYLVTGDKELLHLKKFGKTNIVTYNSFIGKIFRRK